jgi:multimeric flavodoxin WrbA
MGECPLSQGDAFADVMRRVAAASYTIMASPVHFSGLSAPLVGFISRFQVYWGRDVSGMFPGAAGLTVTGGSDYEGMFLAARKVAGAAFATLRMPLAGMVGAGGTDALPAAENHDALARTDALAESMRTRGGAGAASAPPHSS